MHLQAPSCLRAHPLATNLWIGTLTVITKTFPALTSKKESMDQMSSLQRRGFNQTAQNHLHLPAVLGDFPRYTGLLEIALSCCHRPENEGGLCFSITVRLSHETTHLRRDSGPYTNTPLAVCIPSYVRAGRGWGTILRGANELRRLIPI